jgi:predicted outer membrane repeat protein
MDINAANAAELIAAIRAANAAPEEGHTINLTGQDSDYVLYELIEEWFGGNGLPVITSDITVYGNGRLITRSSFAARFRFFMINGRNEHKRARLILHNLTLSNGDTVGMGGGAIVNDGVLLVNNCIFRENHGTLGGAIYAGDLSPTTITGSVFVYNLATQRGGAVFGAKTCQLQVKKSLFYENLSPHGASHVFESVTGTARIEDCFQWDGDVFTRIDNLPVKVETPPEDDAQILLQQALSDAQRIDKIRTDTHHPKPTMLYGKPLPSEPWWHDYVPIATFESIIGQAETEESVPELHIERLIYTGQFQAVHDLAVAVSAHENVLRSKMELMGKILNHIRVRLAYLPGDASLEALLQIAELYDRKNVAGAASAAADQQPMETLIAFFDRNGETFEAMIQELRGKHVMSNQLEFLVALIQEMVLRGLDGESVPSIRNLTEKLRKSYQVSGSLERLMFNGSLKRLPLVRLEMEENLVSALHDGQFVDPPGEDFDTFDAKTHTIGDMPPPLKDITPMYADSIIGAAIAFFDKEARVYQFDSPLTPDAITTRLLLSLDLKFLQNITRMGIRRIDPKWALEHLSRYSNDHRIEPNTPAYKRLAVWASIAGLVGTGGLDNLQLLQDAAKTCHWFYFRGESEYNPDLKALCLAVLRPDGRTLAVLISIVPGDY